MGGGDVTDFGRAGQGRVVVETDDRDGVTAEWGAPCDVRVRSLRRSLFFLFYELVLVKTLLFFILRRRRFTFLSGLDGVDGYDPLVHVVFFFPSYDLMPHVVHADPIHALALVHSS